MALVITEDIKSITELKRNTNSVIDQVQKTKRPVVLTVNGKAKAVLLDAKEYEKISSAFQMLKARSYKLAYATTILAMIPISMCPFPKLVCGVWALVSLSKPLVKRGFQENDQKEMNVHAD